jgi:hypothetical protein
MLFGKSLFQSVVDRLGEEADEVSEADDKSFRINGLNTGFVPPTPDASCIEPSAPRPDAKTDQRLDAYLFLMGEAGEMEEPKAPEPPPPPAWLDRLSPEDVAVDLGLHPSDDRERLQERRRAFARDNHPDRVNADYRDAATQRMKLANRLVDEALHRHDLGIGR